MCVKLQDKKKKKDIFTSSSPRCHERQPPRDRSWGPMELRVGFIALTLPYFWPASFTPNLAIQVSQFIFSSDEMTSPTGWRLLGLNSKFPEEWKVLWVWRMEQKKKLASEIWWKVDIKAKGQQHMRERCGFVEVDKASCIYRFMETNSRKHYYLYIAACVPSTCKIHCFRNEGLLHVSRAWHLISIKHIACFLWAHNDHI